MRTPELSMVLLVLMSLEWISGCGEVLGSGALTTPWRYRAGRSEASGPNTTAWRWSDFNDSSWAKGLMPFHASRSGSGTYLSNMPTQYSSVYLRNRFVVNDEYDVSEMWLRVRCNGGFIAWINNSEIARYNMDGSTPTHSSYAGSLLSKVDKTNVHSLPIPNPSLYLYEGTNLICVQVFAPPGDEGLTAFLDLQLDLIRITNAPNVLAVVPAIGSHLQNLDLVEVFFNRPVTGDLASFITFLRMQDRGARWFKDVTFRQFVYGYQEIAPGVVGATWATNTEIWSLQSESNRFEGNPWQYTLDPGSGAAQVVINEVVSHNTGGLKDEDGDRPDWIEIHNGSSASMNLRGWHLTDDPSNLTKWTFPNWVLLSNSYLVVFASDKNRTNLSAPFHVNFKLSSPGEYLALVKPDGSNIVSEFIPGYPPLDSDTSYGYARPDGKTRVVFSQPTPERPNSARGENMAEDVVFSRSSGAFSEPFELAMAVGSTNALIYYSLDDSLPTENSLRYMGPILISNTVVVRACAFEPGLALGPPRTEAFIALNPTTYSFQSDLPVMVIQNQSSPLILHSWFQPGYGILWEPQSGVTLLTNPPTLSSRAGFKLRGSTTSGFPKRNFTWEWRDEFNQDRKLMTLGMPEESDWVLYAPSYLEPVLIHNPFMYQLSRDLGYYAPRTRFVEVFFHNGDGPLCSQDYQGIYVLTERIKRGNSRVDIHRLDPTDQEEPQISGGYLLKFDRVSPGENGIYIDGLPAITCVDPQERELALPQWQRQLAHITSYLDRFNKALAGSNFSDPETGYAQYIDVPSWIDYHLLNVLAFNVDALGYSAYFYKPRNGKLRYGPIWDFDRALGSNDGRDHNPATWRAEGELPSSDVFHWYWWERLFSDPDFWQRYVDRWQELRTQQFSTNHLFALVDQLALEVRRARSRELLRWPSMKQFSKNDYADEIAAMKDWLKNRLAFIDSILLAPPQFNIQEGMLMSGFPVRLRASNNAPVYYTLDGTDPRAPGGGISTSARLFTTSIAITNDTVIIARSYDANHRNINCLGQPPLSSCWSSAVRGHFQVSDQIQPAGVVINEWYLNKYSGSATHPDGWIELYNSSDQPVDLSDYYLTSSTGPRPVERFPGGTVVSPHDYLLIWAGNSPSVGSNSIPGFFTVDDRLEAALVCLSNPDGQPVDSVVMELLDDKTSEGRWPDAGPEVVSISPPTPGAPNYTPQIQDLPRILEHNTQSDGRLVFTWETTPGLYYQIEWQYENETNALSWTVYQEAILATTNQYTVSIPESDNLHRRFRAAQGPLTPRILDVRMDYEGNIIIAWESVPGVYYRPEFKQHMQDSEWCSLDYVVLATWSEESIAIPVASLKHRFYRINLLQK